MEAEAHRAFDKKEKMFRRRQSDEEARAITDKIGEFPFWEEPFEDRTLETIKTRLCSPWRWRQEHKRR